MATESVEIVRAVFDAVTGGDREGILALYDPAVEVVATPGRVVWFGSREDAYEAAGLRE
jgi:ketosteroid isomerase-like protein